MTKKILRSVVKKQIASFSQEYIDKSNKEIYIRLCETDEIQQARLIFCYVSVGREVDTRAFINKMLASGKTVCVPRCIDKFHMEARQITSLDDLVPANYGLLEPTDHQTRIPPRDLELVIAPCLATDTQGHRLGHGAGYYDRYLADVTCPVICLCREALLQETIPWQTHDRAADVVVTERKTWRK